MTPVILLYVNQNGLLTDTKCQEWNGKDLPSFDGIVYFQLDSLKEIVIPGSLNASSPSPNIGGFLGFFSGILLGGVIGYRFSDEDPTPFVVGVVAGAVLGGLLGNSIKASLSQESLTRSVNPQDSSAIDQIRTLCVYPNELPKELRGRAVVR
ncbi:MAG: hypothetical protein WBQ23_14210 [Bacteroidota bacterium]